MENCEVIIQHHERLHGIPGGLLRAISRIESGRYFPGQGVVAWPWTINCNGNAYYLNSKKEAIAKAKLLQSQGITSMDVGPMQINLKHHPDAFSSLDDAFDPWANIAYAAQFLVQKKNAQGNWQDAVAHYHSATAAHNIPYRQKVMESWSKNGNQSPTQTVFNMNSPQMAARRPGMASTLFSGASNRRIPLKVKFPRYTKDGRIRSQPSGMGPRGGVERIPPRNPHSIINQGGNSRVVPSLISRTVPGGIPIYRGARPQVKGAATSTVPTSQPNQKKKLW